MRSVRMYSKQRLTELPTWAVGGSALLLWVVLILALPVRWILAAVISILFHEFCHYVCVILLGGCVHRISVTGKGVVMNASGLTPGRELLAALAGPLGGLILLLFAKPFPRLALCALFHSGCNLLPIYPLDGGRALRDFLTIVLPNRAQKLFFWCQRCILAILVSACLWASLGRGLGALPLLLAAVLLLKTRRTNPGFHFPGNNPCKAAECAVK